MDTSEQFRRPNALMIFGLAPFLASLVLLAWAVTHVSEIGEGLYVVGAIVFGAYFLSAAICGLGMLWAFQLIGERERYPSKTKRTMLIAAASLLVPWLVPFWQIVAR